MAASVNLILQDQIARVGKEKLIARLSKNLVKHGSCWIWVGALTQDGYPRMNFRYRGKHTQVYVHHVFYVLRTGEDVKRGIELDHKCQIPACVWCTQEITSTRNKQLVHERKTKKANRVST